MFLENTASRGPRSHRRRLQLIANYYSQITSSSEVASNPVLYLYFQRHVKSDGFAEGPLKLNQELTVKFEHLRQELQQVRMVVVVDFESDHHGSSKQP